MEKMDGSENPAKISDSAFTNNKSRRSSKSIYSGSNSSGSSHYGRKPSTSGYSFQANHNTNKKDNIDDLENPGKISDSAYSTSCNNSQSRRSHSSKSTLSGSNSSGSSGYGRNPSTSTYSFQNNHYTQKMDNIDDLENPGKISDSAYSNSCNNSQSRSHSSKSTLSGSNSSGSSGYGRNPSTSTYSINNTNQPQEKRIKEKEVKNKKKKSQVKLPKMEYKQSEVQTEPQCDPPEPVKDLEVPKEEQINVSVSSPPSGSHVEGAVETMDICSSDETSCNEKNGSENQLVESMNMVPSRSNSIHRPDFFSCVISMHDGVVMYATSSITAMLDYPKDMWIGRSFLDFVHERDRNIFASQITSGLAVPKNVNGMQPKATTQVNTSSSMVCRLRRYRGLSSGFGVKDRVVSFLPFLLKLSFKKINDNDGDCIYLVIQATPFFSAFKMPYEVLPKTAPFVIRHAASGNIEYIDPESVPYLGYLPQDLVDKNALQLYHPHDLDYLQKVYETIVKEGSVARGSPYRIMVQNGDYIRLETEWSSFINPWSRKLEFVIGKHHIVEGPRNPDVFQTPDPEMMFKLNEDDKAKTQCMRENIVRIMNEVLTKPAEAAKQQMTKRCQNLAAFMETLMEDTPKVEEDLRLEIQDVDNSYYERDSVMLEGISPHYDYNDSKSSTDTPVSYTQLNYNDTLQRYFDNHQPYDSEETNTMSGENTYEINNPMAVTGNSSSSLPLNPADCGDISLPPRPNKSNTLAIMSSTSTLNQDYTPMRLTETLLKRHNVEMEKELVKHHRETRSTRSEREKASIENRQKKKEHLARCNASFQPTSAGPHGVKRASKASDADAVAHKHQCTSPRQQRRWQSTAASTIHSSSVVSNVAASPWSTPCADSMNMFILGMDIPQPVPMVTPVSAVPGIVPMYYTAPLNTPLDTDTEDISNRRQCQHPSMQCVMYGQAMYGSPFIYAPVGSQVTYDMHPNFINQSNQYPNNVNPLGLARRNYEEACKLSLPVKTKPFTGSSWRDKKSALQGRLLKIDPGSGSNSSAEISHRTTDAIADSTRGCMFPKHAATNNNEDVIDKTDGESSYSSFYSSFFKTESGSAEDSDAKKGSKEGGKPKYWTKLSHSEDSMSMLSPTERRYGKNKQTKNVPKRTMDPPWMEQVCVTSELIYKYQVTNRSMEEVLSGDKKRMQSMEQPPLVNEQLGQLYLDLQLEGVAARLTLEEGVTSSSSSGEESAGKSSENKYRRKKREYSKLVMIYEEDAPLPPPNDMPCSPTSLFR